MIIPSVNLDGDPYARGRRLGVARQQKIQSYTTEWLRYLSAIGVTNPEKYLTGMLQSVKFLEAVDLHTPDVLAEVRGVADGSGTPFELLYAVQLMDEEWAYRTKCIGSAGLQKCSSVAVRSRVGSVVVGQNMDLGNFTDGHQVIMRLMPHASKPGAMIFSVDSMIALMGVNSCGVAVCVNSLPQLSSSHLGLPVAFFIRKLLQAESLAEGVEMIRSIPHATGQCYLVADESEIRVFEASSAGVVEYISPDPSRVIHTNHPISYPGVQTSANDINSVTRFRCLNNRLPSRCITLDQIKAALASQDDQTYPVSRAESGSVNRVTGVTGFTTGSLISELRENSEAIETWVSLGPPHIHGFTRMDARFPPIGPTLFPGIGPT